MVTTISTLSRSGDDCGFQSKSPTRPDPFVTSPQTHKVHLTLVDYLSNSGLANGDQSAVSVPFRCAASKVEWIWKLLCSVCDLWTACSAGCYLFFFGNVFAVPHFSVTSLCEGSIELMLVPEIFLIIWFVLIFKLGENIYVTQVESILKSSTWVGVLWLDPTSLTVFKRLLWLIVVNVKLNNYLRYFVDPSITQTSFPPLL